MHDGDFNNDLDKATKKTSKKASNKITKRTSDKIIKKVSNKANTAIILILLFVSIFSWSWMNIFVPFKANVHPTENLFVYTHDGVKIYYNLYEPSSYIIGAERKNAEDINPANGDRINAVIVAHGIMINKECMKTLSLEIASEGFLVIDIDWRSHGRSTGDFNIIMDGNNADSNSNSPNTEEIDSISDFFDYSKFQFDIEAIKNMLDNRGDVNLTNLGYVGMSMGGGIGFYILQNDPSFNAMVGICPASEYKFVNKTAPPNLLMLASKFDEAIPYASVLKVMENKTGVNRDLIAQSVGENSYWEFENGSFFEGTAARMYYNLFEDHFLSPWDKQYIREAKTWLIRALTPSRAANLSLNQREGRGALLPVVIYNDLIISAWISLIGVLGLVFIVIYFVLTKLFTDLKSGDDSGETLEKRNSVIISNDLFIFKKNFNLKSFFGKDILFVLIFGFPMMLTFIPFFLLPQLFLSVDLMLLWGPSISMIVFIIIYIKKNPKIINLQLVDQGKSDQGKSGEMHNGNENKTGIGRLHGEGAFGLLISLYKRAFKRTSWRNLIIGVLCGFIYYFGVIISIGNIFGLVPAENKIISIIIYFPITFYIYLNFAIAFQGIVQDFLLKKGIKNKDFNGYRCEKSNLKRFVKVGVINFGIIMLITLFILITPSVLSGVYFILMFLIPITLVHVGTVILGIITYERSRDVILSALTMAILPCIMFSTLSPLFSVLSFF